MKTDGRCGHGWAIGDAALLSGLQKAELNGEVALAIGLEGDRVAVELQSCNRKFKVKPCNLRAFSAPPQSGDFDVASDIIWS